MILPSHVTNDDGSQLGSLFPSYIPEPERLVYEYVHEATGSADADGNPQFSIGFPENDAVPLRLPAEFDRPPLLDFYGGRTDGPAIPVVRGWPQYPGQVPAIGVAGGNATEDDAQSQEGGGFAGDLYAVDASGAIVGTATYYAQPFLVPVIVELIHENRDERDRLHERLNLVLFGLRRILPQRYPLVKKVRVDWEKSEVSGGPPDTDQPFQMYVSVFTVHVWYEVLEAVDVTGPEGVITSGDQITITADYTATLADAGIHSDPT